jgi:hypothetical protein
MEQFLLNVTKFRLADFIRIAIPMQVSDFRQTKVCPDPVQVFFRIG